MERAGKKKMMMMRKARIMKMRMYDHRLNSALPQGSAFVPWFVLKAKPGKPVVSIQSETLRYHRRRVKPV